MFLAVSSMIVTAFLMKSYRKLHENPEANEENRRPFIVKYEALSEDVKQAIAKMTTMPPSKDQCDTMATGRFA